MAWILRLVKTGAEGDGQSTDVMEINKATPRNKRVMLRFWVSEARLCNSILDGMRRL